MSQEPWIKATELTKKYGKTAALDSLSLSVGGGVTLLYGPNGAGKSTLVSLLEGLAMPTEGQVEIGGAEPARRPEALMARFGYLPERPVSFGSNSVADFLYWYMKIGGSSHARLRQLITAFSADHLMSHKFSSLSLGEMQLVSLVAVLSLDREGYVLDEPNSSLDYHRRRVLAREISAMRSAGKKFLVSTHIVDELIEIVDRSFGLNRGKLAFSSEDHEGGRGSMFTVNIIASDPKAVMQGLTRYSPRVVDGRILVDGASTGEVLNNLSQTERMAISSIYLTPRMDFFE